MATGLFGANSGIFGFPTAPEYAPILKQYDIIPIIEEGRAFAQSMEGVAAALANELAILGQGLLFQTIDTPTLPVGTVSPYVSPALPSPPAGINATFPPPPTFAGLGTVAPLTLSEPPVASIALPDVNFGSAPTPFGGVVPEPDSLSAVAIPSAPTLTFPASPSLANIVIPDIPTLNLPQFTATLGDVPLAPSPAFAFTEVTYSSELLEDVRTLILSWVNGASTGISAAVEEAIWNRARDREAANYVASQDQIFADYAARGFPLPGGAIAVDIARAREAFRGKTGDINREIAIKQAELEQSNRRFAIEQGFQIESTLVTYASQRAGRAFEAAKYLVEAAIEVYKIQVTQYNADVEAFKARAQVYGEVIRGELGRLEVYKAQIQGQQLVASINEQTVKIYTAQLSAVETQIKVFESQVRAASVQADVNKTVIEQYRARVQAYAETVRAKSLEYEGYSTQVKAEVSKYELPKIQADIYRAQTDGYRALTQAAAQAKEIEMEVTAKLPIEVYKGQVMAYEAEVRGLAESLKALTQIYETDGRIFGEQVRGEGQRISGEVGVLDATTKTAQAQAQIIIEAAKANVSNAVENIRLRIEAARGAAQVMAQVAAGAMSGLSLSAGASQSFNEGNSTSKSASQSASSSASFIDQTIRKG